MVLLKGCWSRGWMHLLCWWIDWHRWQRRRLKKRIIWGEGDTFGRGVENNVSRFLNLVMNSSMSAGVSFIMAATCCQFASPPIRYETFCAFVKTWGERSNKRDFSTVYAIPGSPGFWTLSSTIFYLSDGDKRCVKLVPNAVDQFCQFRLLAPDCRCH